MTITASVAPMMVPAVEDAVAGPVTMSSAGSAMSVTDGVGDAVVDPAAGLLDGDGRGLLLPSMPLPLPVSLAGTPTDGDDDGVGCLVEDREAVVVGCGASWNTSVGRRYACAYEPP